MRFSPAAWAQGDSLIEARPAIRQRMLGDLLARHPLRGMTRDSVLALLGPRRTDYFKSWDLAYYLGPEGGMLPIDSEWLVVAFDSTGLVQDYQIVRD